ncbi:hypothetical protein DBV15_08532, partial [Temnothorax longispinosus]
MTGAWSDNRESQENAMLHFDKRTVLFRHVQHFRNVFASAGRAGRRRFRSLLKSKDALATLVSTLDKAGWLSMKGRSLFHVPEAIRVIICHYPTNVYPRHLMGHQAGPRYGVSHGGRGMKIGANFRYIVGQLYEREKDLSPMFHDKLRLIRFTKWWAKGKKTDNVKRYEGEAEEKKKKKTTTSTMTRSRVAAGSLTGSKRKRDTGKSAGYPSPVSVVVPTRADVILSRTQEDWVRPTHQAQRPVIPVDAVVSFLLRSPSPPPPPRRQSSRRRGTVASCKGNTRSRIKHTKPHAVVNTRNNEFSAT